MIAEEVLQTICQRVVSDSLLEVSQVQAGLAIILRNMRLGWYRRPDLNRHAFKGGGF